VRVEAADGVRGAGDLGGADGGGVVDHLALQVRELKFNHARTFAGGVTRLRASARLKMHGPVETDFK
jgi:hypothetical protein